MPLLCNNPPSLLLHTPTSMTLCLQEQVATHIATLIEHCSLILTHRSAFLTDTADAIQRIVSELFPPLLKSDIVVRSGLPVSIHAYISWSNSLTLIHLSQQLSISRHLIFPIVSALVSFGCPLPHVGSNTVVVIVRLLLATEECLSKEQGLFKLMVS